MSTNEMPDISRKLGECVRRINRFTDGPMTRKKLVIIILVFLLLFLYAGPSTLRWIFNTTPSQKELIHICQTQFLSQFDEALLNYDAYLRRENAIGALPVSKNYVPYVGNGHMGLVLDHDAHLNVKKGRSLSLPVNFHPLYIVEDYEMNEITVTDYKNGIVHRYQCSESNVQVSYKYYAHRTIPSLFVQEIWVSNTSPHDMTLKLRVPRVSQWPTAVKQTVNLHQGVGSKEYEVINGMIQLSEENKVIAVALVTRKINSILKVTAKDGVDLLIMTTVEYSHPISEAEYATYKDIVEKKALKAMEKAISLTNDRSSLKILRDNHSRVWNNLWYTGFYISDSKAKGIINGDRINATIYITLSQVRSYENEDAMKPSTKYEILKSLTYSEGCYGGHSTLEAENLWKPIDSLEHINEVASYWLITLEKNGCHNLLKAGSSGVNQAMILSFGSLRFSNQHLEFNIHPSKLHRDFLFRRINYGNMTHVNITVMVQEDNKAAIFVALDRSDRSYYACDAGCLDSPVLLGPYRKYFPVKTTEPLTSILYITADKQHMEDLRVAIHVTKIKEAPPHEDHVLALHKHGHDLGLHPLFWVTIGLLIVVFHIFLCRIVMNEFCDSGTGYRRLYNRP